MTDTKEISKDTTLSKAAIFSLLDTVIDAGLDHGSSSPHYHDAKSDVFSMYHVRSRMTDLDEKFPLSCFLDMCVPFDRATIAKAISFFKPNMDTQSDMSENSQKSTLDILANLACYKNKDDREPLVWLEP
jgi:hypothetical protein